MEACGGAHVWARELDRLGHTVKLMSPTYVKAYVKRGKHDAADAAAICEAVSRRHVEAVTAKSVAQQCQLMLHKARDSAIATRTQKINEIRAHLLELGITAPVGQPGFDTLLAKLHDDADADIPQAARIALLPLVAIVKTAEASIAACEATLRRTAKDCATTRRLEAIPGVGPLSASAFAAVAADVTSYRSARHYAASLGLTPRITGTGGEIHLGSITKAGNGYLRRLLYMGAIARLQWARRHPDKADPRIVRLLADKPYKVAAIALANRMARTIWAMLVRGGDYVKNHRPSVPAAIAVGCR
jgi:transposase